MLDKATKKALVLIELVFERVVAGHEELIAYDTVAQTATRLVEYDKTMAYDEFVSFMLGVLDSLYVLLENETLKRRWIVSNAAWRVLCDTQYPTHSEPKFEPIRIKFWMMARTSEQEYEAQSPF